MIFSIVVPSYNRNNEIHSLLSSLSLQTKYNFEVIIVDDCSTQAVEITEPYPFEVSVVRNPSNLGAAESRNVGVNHANNEWILFLDDDDRFENNKCEILKNVIVNHPEINFIYHPAKCVMVNEKFSYYTKPFSNEKDLTLDNILLANKIGGMPMIAIKKTLFKQVGGLSTKLRSLEDYEFLLKLLNEKSFNPKYVADVLTICTFHTQRSSVSTNIKHTKQAVDFILEKFVVSKVQKDNFKLNSLYILAYPYMMNLSREAGKYYFEMFKLSRNLKHLVMSLVVFISPKLAINLKRFI